MARTESKILEVAPQNENEVVKTMEKFGWSLQNRQEIHFTGNSVTRPTLFSGYGGVESYITTYEVSHYTKLHFSRPVDTPNLDRIHLLENEYFSMVVPNKPKLVPGSIWLWIILCLFFGIGIAIWILYYFLSYKPNKEKFDSEVVRISARAREIEEEIDKLV
jgi:hypothetical protein